VWRVGELIKAIIRACIGPNCKTEVFNMQSRGAKFFIMHKISDVALFSVKVIFSYLFLNTLYTKNMKQSTNTQLHLVPWLRRGGVITSLPQYAFSTWLGTTSLMHDSIYPGVLSQCLEIWLLFCLHWQHRSCCLRQRNTCRHNLYLSPICDLMFCPELF
jgi:hypothetical protein